MKKIVLSLTLLFGSMVHYSTETAIDSAMRTTVAEKIALSAAIIGIDLVYYKCMPENDERDYDDDRIIQFPPEEPLGAMIVGFASFCYMCAVWGS